METRGGWGVARALRQRPGPLVRRPPRPVVGVVLPLRRLVRLGGLAAGVVVARAGRATVRVEVGGRPGRRVGRGRRPQQRRGPRSFPIAEPGPTHSPHAGSHRFLPVLSPPLWDEWEVPETRGPSVTPGVGGAGRHFIFVVICHYYRSCC